MLRPINRSIRDHLPTVDDVRSAGTAFEERYWRRDEYRNLGSGIDELGLADGRQITRADVFELVDRHPHQAVKLTLIWGFPQGNINGHIPPLDALFGEAGKVADHLKDLRRREQTSARILIEELNRVCGKGVSTSTTSKLAYFFGLKSREGPCLIYDYRVINSIMESGFQEFAALRRVLPAEAWLRSRDKKRMLGSAQSRQVQTYATYLETVHNVAKRLTEIGGTSVEGDQIELALFGGAPESRLLSARTRKWNQKRRRGRSGRSSQAID